ncbi:hypothetical protein EG68_05279 [Paragonimus skrjabini miyazakii]|uniref:Uncharacterized protein n=1 Tax=Paragonimus skrjabini miyazakii TaxID=59628 RepID=A0A8S9Z0J2_9TREM|nr:hypothetical protein EG68_05279 [Paragonimus skrjabini miyazakii]
MSDPCEPHVKRIRTIDGIEFETVYNELFKFLTSTTSSSVELSSIVRKDGVNTQPKHLNALITWFVRTPDYRPPDDCTPMLRVRYLFSRASCDENVRANFPFSIFLHVNLG